MSFSIVLSAGISKVQTLKEIEYGCGNSVGRDILLGYH
jgi:hypothetical protein